jgi:hypothetical protein
MDESNGSKPQEQILPVDNATVPYWRTELHALDEHRTTEELPTECDIAIIGAGMTGVSTGYHISKLAGDNPPSVVILEARQLCSGATGRNGVGQWDPRWQNELFPNSLSRVIARYKRQLCSPSRVVSERARPQKH